MEAQILDILDVLFLLNNMSKINIYTLPSVQTLMFRNRFWPNFSKKWP